MLVGVASIDITPPVGVVLDGYKLRISTAVGHRLRAEAIVCQGEDGQQWAMITSDILEYRKHFAKNICSEIAEATGIPAQSIVLSATHTHSGPATKLFDDPDAAKIDREYLTDLKAKLISLVVEAKINVKPGTFETAWTTATDLAHNRRVQLNDGEWENQWEDHYGEHPGEYDSSILLVAVRRDDGRRDALIVNYGCHPVVLGPGSLDISADYVGYMKDRIEAKAEVGVVMFATAGCGDINPRVCIQVGEKHPKEMGEKVADIVLSALGGLSSVGYGKVSCHCHPWVMTRTRDVAELRGEPGGCVGDEIQTVMIAARAGDVGLISIPGELFTQFNERLRAKSGLAATMIVTLSNDYIGYLPTDAGQLQGAYEASIAPCEELEKSLIECAGKAFGGIS